MNGPPSPEQTEKKTVQLATESVHLSYSRP